MFRSSLNPLDFRGIEQVSLNADDPSFIVIYLNCPALPNPKFTIVYVGLKK